jgi:hypothetical protein
MVKENDQPDSNASANQSLEEMIREKIDNIAPVDYRAESLITELEISEGRQIDVNDN